MGFSLHAVCKPKFSPSDIQISENSSPIEFKDDLCKSKKLIVTKNGKVKYIYKKGVSIK